MIHIKLNEKVNKKKKMKFPNNKYFIKIINDIKLLLL